jgi:hypothetical protein
MRPFILRGYLVRESCLPHLARANYAYHRVAVKKAAHRGCLNLSLYHV